jgi:hypothetical protein
MARTIAAAFAKLSSNLEITDLQAAVVSTRQKRVREAMERRMSVLTSFLSGSYKRSTMIAPLSEADIDIFVILDPAYFKKYTPATLLDRVRAVLLETYPKTPRISRNGQAVTITFTDFTVDVVPGFHREGGGYLIPDSRSGQWISTDPTVHDSKLAEANRLHQRDLIPLIKMIKGWNKAISDPFVGFYLELMTTNILFGVTISDFPSGVRFVLDRGRERIKYKIIDPAGFGDQVNGLAGVSTVTEALSRFTTAYNRAAKAELLAAGSKVEAAIEEWRKVFGSYFPAYG